MLGVPNFGSCNFILVLRYLRVVRRGVVLVLKELEHHSHYFLEYLLLLLGLEELVEEVLVDGLLLLLLRVEVP